MSVNACCIKGCIEPRWYGFYVCEKHFKEIRGLKIENTSDDKNDKE